MSALLTRLAHRIAQRPGLAIAALVLFLLPAAYFATQVGISGAGEALFLERDPARAALARFTQEFGGDEQIIVGVQGAIFTEEGLAALDELTRDLQALPGVERALSITNVKNLYQGPVEVYPWAPYEWVLDGDRTPAELQGELIAEPLFAGNLISATGDLAAVIVTLRNATAQVVHAVRQRAAQTPGLRTVVAGFPVERVDFAQAVRADQQRLVPAVLAMIILISGLLFRQVWAVVLTLAVVGSTVLLTMGVAGLAGVTLNPVTSLLMPVVMVVSVAVATNVIVAYGQLPERGAEGIARAYGRVGPAVAFTTLTTALGFGALVGTGVPAIAQFGALCAVGVTLSYGVGLLLLPASMGLRRPMGPAALTFAEPRRRFTRLVKLGQWTGRHHRVVLVVAAGLVAVGLWGASRLRVETDILAQLPPDSALAQATAVLEAGLGGVNVVELLFTSEPGTLREPEAVRAMAEVVRAVESCCGAQVAKIFWVGDILARVHAVKTGTRALPSSNRDLRDYLELLALAPGDDNPTDLYLNDEGSAARVSVRLAATSSTATFQVLQAARAAAAEQLPSSITMTPTGQFVLVQNMTEALPRGQLRGLLWATALIIACIALLLRSLWLGAVAALPASVPVLAVYGLMGVSGIPLSTATSMIASVVLGLAVDSTILFLTRYRDARRAGKSPLAAERTMLQSVGQSVLYSNLTLVGGFGIAALSSFPPARDFAILTALTMGVSLLTAWLGVPSLLRLVEREGR